MYFVVLIGMKQVQHHYLCTPEFRMTPSVCRRYPESSKALLLNHPGHDSSFRYQRVCVNRSAPWRCCAKPWSKACRVCRICYSFCYLYINGTLRGDNIRFLMRMREIDKTIKKVKFYCSTVANFVSSKLLILHHNDLNEFYDLSALVGCLSSVFIRRNISKCLNVCALHCTVVAGVEGLAR